MEALPAIFIIILVVAIPIAISRWIFRINRIVKRLDEIVELLRVTNA